MKSNQKYYEMRDLEKLYELTQKEVNKQTAKILEEIAKYYTNR